MERKDYLDVAKLFSVLCVIYIHSATTDTAIRQTITTFFMPVFFIIYGFASSKKPLRSGKEICSFVLKRAKSLLVPYVLWAMIYAGSIDINFIKNVIIGNNLSLGRAETNMVLWFLPCMFISVLLFQVYIDLSSFIDNKYYKLGFSVLASVICGAISCIFNGFEQGGRIFGYDIAFTGCVFMIIGEYFGILVNFWKKKPFYVKMIVGMAGMLLTYGIACLNISYLEQIGYKRVVMARAIYGRYDLFLVGGVAGSFAMLLIAMVFERVRLFAYMGRFSLVIMAVHHLLFPYVKPLCSAILDIKYGDMIYPAAVSLCCFVICIPLCCIIDWAVPELNGKSMRMQQMK